jgi:predicted O-linked N-acetylglucosamine transferase (SPINDLY family)
MALSWHPRANQLLQDELYDQVAEFYEHLLDEQPHEISHYWYLGLAYLLQQREEDAQTTWMAPTLDAEPEQISEWTEQLQLILNTEALRQAQLAHLKLSWLIRGHLHTLVPDEVNNLLHLLSLSVATQVFTGELLHDWHVIETLQQGNPDSIDAPLLASSLEQVLNALIKVPDYESETTAFCQACQHCASSPSPLLPIISKAATKAFYLEKRKRLAVNLVELCLEVEPDNLFFLKELHYFHHLTGAFETAAVFAARYSDRAQSLPQQVYGNMMQLHALLMIGGRWPDVTTLFAHQKTLLSDLAQRDMLEADEAFPLITAPFSFNYLDDDPLTNRSLQNSIAKLCQSSLPPEQKHKIEQLRKPRSHPSTPRKLKIGYLSHHFSQHSIGWLCRWLFQYHNRDNFHIALYLFSQPISTFTQYWFLDRVDSAFHLELPNSALMAQRIAEDEVDILIDLESVTHANISYIMALNPAPVQATWLGADASGLSTVDYYIADPYVLPAEAQDYYQEKIWRLPKTYLAVDGFEADAPTLRRDHLNIPNDAVIYFSSQTGQKRHPDLVQLQMQILQNVPDSYLIIKGFSDNQSVQTFFVQFAEQYGINPSRLCFLEPAPTELVHRANLQIADVVLDTFPYNGATTTLEVLWMGIPLVTRVGQQFAARNSYAFLMNAGVTEGIAWTDREYIEWGIRLGTDEALRQHVSWKLKKSRHTSPLWNTQQFTHDLEQAYQQMYLEKCG